MLKYNWQASIKIKLENEFEANEYEPSPILASVNAKPELLLYE